VLVQTVIETFGILESTSPYSGAIVSRGGVGVGNSISIGGRLIVT